MWGISIFFFLWRVWFCCPSAQKNYWEKNWLLYQYYIQSWFVIGSHVCAGASCHLALKTLSHICCGVSVEDFCVNCGSRFIKGVAISTRHFKICLCLFSLPPHTHPPSFLSSSKILWQSNTWFGQRGLTGLPSTWPLISHLHQQTEAWPALHHQPHKHLRNKTSSNCEYAGLLQFVLFLSFFYVQVWNKRSYFVPTRLRWFCSRF